MPKLLQDIKNTCSWIDNTIQWIEYETSNKSKPVQKNGSQRKRLELYLKELQSLHEGIATLLREAQQDCDKVSGELDEADALLSEVSRLVPTPENSTDGSMEPGGDSSVTPKEESAKVWVDNIDLLLRETEELLAKPKAVLKPI